MIRVDCVVCGALHECRIGAGPYGVQEVHWQNAECDCADSQYVKHMDYWEAMDERAFAVAYEKSEAARDERGDHLYHAMRDGEL